MPLPLQVICKAIWRYTEKSNQCNAIMQLHMQVIWEDIWKHTAGKGHTNAINVNMHHTRRVIWGLIWKHTAEKNGTNAINASSHAPHLKIRLRTYIRVTLFKSNQSDCATPSSCKYCDCDMIELYFLGNLPNKVFENSFLRIVLLCLFLAWGKRCIRPLIDQ